MKRIIAMLCAMVALSALAQEPGLVIDGLRYILRGGEFVAVKGLYSDAPAGDVIIKDYVEIDGNTYPVSVIEFITDADGRKIIIPQTVKEIRGRLEGAILDGLPVSLEACGFEAFTDVNLPETVNLPQSKDIGPDSFKGAKGVKKIILGHNLERLGAYAFWGTEISEVIFEDGGQENGTSHCISNMAVYGMSRLKEIKLPKWSNLELGDCVIRGCENLERVIFPDIPTIEYGYCLYYSGFDIMNRNVPVYGYLFKDCPKLKEIVCLGETPVEITNIDNFKEKNEWVHNTAEEFTFMDNMDGCVLKVPAGSEALYRAHPVWGRFKTILGFKNGDYGTTAIIAPAAYEAAAEPVYYNLQGMHIQDPVKGQLYIRTIGSKTDKVVY